MKTAFHLFHILNNKGDYKFHFKFKMIGKGGTKSLEMQPVKISNGSNQFQKVNVYNDHNQYFVVKKKMLKLFSLVFVYSKWTDVFKKSVSS